MLVLSRKENESIALFGGFVNVFCVRHGDTKARIGIEAPECVSIVRREMLPTWVKPHQNIQSAAALLRYVAVTNSDPLIEQAIRLLDEAAGRGGDYVDPR